MSAKSTDSNSFLLSSTFFPSVAKSTSYLAPLFCLALVPLPQILVLLPFFYHKLLFSCHSSTTNPCSPALSLTRNSIQPYGYFTFSYGFIVVDCVGWKSSPVLLLMIPVLWSSCCLHQPALLPIPEKPEICFSMTFGISITHFSSCWQFQRWQIMISAIRWASYPWTAVLSFPHQQTGVFHFFCSSSPLPYPEICSCRSFSFQASPFPFAKKINSLVAHLKEYWSLLFLCSCSFSPYLYPVWVWPFRQKSCHTFLFPANLRSLFYNCETQSFRRCCELEVGLS